jgi:hypothetical protein
VVASLPKGEITMKRVVFLLISFIFLTNMSIQASVSLQGTAITSNTRNVSVLNSTLTTNPAPVVEKPIRYGTEINFDQASLGIVRVFYNETVEKKMKLIVQLGEAKYVYNLFRSNDYVNYPLQLGDGQYTVSVFENTTGTKYRKVASSSFQVVLKNQNDVYLQSILEINWNEEDESIKLADEIVAQALAAKKAKTAVSKRAQVVLTEKEIVNELYMYIIKNYKYDYKKIETLDFSYTPDNDSFLISKKGICYDYSSLLASMLRSQGIPTKMVKGYANESKVYHAWNEIYVSSEKRWVVTDITNDAYMIQNGFVYTFEKDPKAYNKVKEF